MIVGGSGRPIPSTLCHHAAVRAERSFCGSRAFAVLTPYSGSLLLLRLTDDWTKILVLIVRSEVADRHGKLRQVTKERCILEEGFGKLRLAQLH